MFKWQPQTATFGKNHHESQDEWGEAVRLGCYICSHLWDKLVVRSPYKIESSVAQPKPVLKYYFLWQEHPAEYHLTFLFGDFQGYQFLMLPFGGETGSTIKTYKDNETNF